MIVGRIEAVGDGITVIVEDDGAGFNVDDSRLRDAIDVLHGVDGISFTFFQARDVVRHPLVARIVEAYDAARADD